MTKGGKGMTGARGRWHVSKSTKFRIPAEREFFNILTVVLGTGRYTDDKTMVLSTRTHKYKYRRNWENLNKIRRQCTCQYVSCDYHIIIL